MGKNICNYLTHKVINKINLYNSLEISGSDSLDNIPATPNKGVYFLFSEDNELIYIGKSKHIQLRVATHVKKMDFVYYKYILIDCDEEMSLAERVLINKYMPKYNQDNLTEKLRDNE